MASRHDSSRSRILEAFATLRVADVRDGMDTLMLHHVGSMEPEVRPLWRTRIAGIAKTARYLPYQGTIPQMTPAEYAKWSGWYYGNVCTYPWMDEMEAGDIAVIDQSEVNAGLIGSENTMRGLVKGGLGYVTNGGVRDTDEIIRQKVPVWAKIISQTMVQGRIQYDSHNVPVAVAGVRVNPGDVVVADGDGVIVVPQDVALDVARHAAKEHESDMKNRRRLYDALGIKPDDTVASRGKAGRGG
jgi:regulator of RNase E activity RraA